MEKLTTSFLGIELKNPIIVGASNLVTKTSILKHIEQAGAAAIVYKSLFEEQIQLENLELFQKMEEYSERNAEMIRLFPDIGHAGPKEYLLNLEKAREAVHIPLFASLNCVNDESWVEYAKLIEKTGVDGLELNFYSNPVDIDKSEPEIIEELIDTIRKIKNAIKIPIGIKLSPFYTNILNVIHQMDKIGVDGFILFNRLFQPDIDIHNEENFFPYNLSGSDDYKLPLRYAGLLHGNLNAGICANSGIYNGDDVIKVILAGADCVQVVSTVYKNGVDHIEKMILDIEHWMQSKKYNSIEEFKGKLSRKNIKDPFAYRRAQYVDILMKSTEIFKKYPTI